MMEAMQPINEDGTATAPEYEWDGLRRRRTMTVNSRRPQTSSSMAGAIPPVPMLSPSPQPPRSPHPPLGMSRFPDDYEESDDGHNDDRSSFLSSIAGTVLRGRNRSRTTATLPTYVEEYRSDKVRSPMHPVPLTDINKPHPKNEGDDEADAYFGHTREHQFPPLDTSYRGGSAGGPSNKSSHSLKPPTPPPHTAKRQFSFNKVFRKQSTPTEEERAGLVKDDGSGENLSSPEGSDRDDRNDGKRGGPREAFI